MRPLVFCAAAAVLASCSSGALPYMQNGAALRHLTGTGAGKIKHVVYIIQENRSFDNLFQGYPGADTVSSGKDSSGHTIALQPVSLRRAYNIDHSASAMFAACHGTGKLPGTECRMDGFNKEFSYGGPRHPEYVYVPHDESKPYFEMAHEGVLADRMFQSQLDESYVAHQYIIAAQAASSVDLPDGGFWSCLGGTINRIATITPQRDPNGPTEQACFDYQTLGDELDDAHLTWRFYASRYGDPASGDGSEWSSYGAIRHIFLTTKWLQDVRSPQKNFITDVAKGQLASFTWITPECRDSDHVDCGGGFGPSWVAALVNAVGESKFWDSTAVFVQWDDWGGLYDHVPPPYEGYDGVGFRVPLIVISPYAKHDYVSHVQYETTSVLRFAEDLYGLKQLAEADARANSPAYDCFDFSQKPRAFVPIKAPKKTKFFLQQGDDYRAPDYE
ncbi:MAG TPA: alkaline phosphatase family protein [Candidatus Cybelea sp.]|nr:alkaline phosphatase family protein [Candidatus Cybelea sp.]